MTQFLNRFYQRLMYEVDPYRELIQFWEVVKGEKIFFCRCAKIKGTKVFVWLFVTEKSSNYIHPYITSITVMDFGCDKYSYIIISLLRFDLQVTCSVVMAQANIAYSEWCLLYLHNLISSDCQFLSSQNDFRISRKVCVISCYSKRRRWKSK